MVLAVERLDVALADVSQRRGYLAGPLSAREQMHMVAHQHIRMQRNRVLTQHLTKQFELMAAAVIVDENGGSIYTTMRDVQRDGRQSDEVSYSRANMRGADSSLHSISSVFPVRRMRKIS